VKIIKGFPAKNADPTLKVVEFCIFDELTLGFFKQEFDKI